MSDPNARRVRVIDLETAGSSPSDVCEVGWQDVELGPDGTWQVSATSRGARFVDPGRPISPGTMAVHHILDEWVAGVGYWRDVAPAVLRPEGGVMALAAHRASFEQRHCTPDLTGSADWVCTWKCALRLWPDLPRFSNQMLRYLRRPEGLDHDLGLPAHRALPDAYVTAHHLRDMLNAAPLETLLDWSRQPGLLPRVPTGAHRGKTWSAVADAALAILVRDRDPDIRFSAETEVRRRTGQAGLDDPLPVQRTLL
ncbi:DNA polymerase III subunit epsilon [Brevundimonas poindexterae]|uniref:DNA polymerase III subunit epsilon n=1 Tax=Brevundimonas poindexterae TaxID=74325 RepID=UPI001CFE546C|nr:DNA polymerase III subunit epsilon [Brevundimonas poindexterae]